MSSYWHFQREDRKGERINLQVASPEINHCILDKKSKTEHLFPVAALEMLCIEMVNTALQC